MLKSIKSGGIVKRIIISTILIMLCGCTTVSLNPIEKEKISQSFLLTKNEFMLTVKENRKKDIHKFFVNSLKNEIILNNIDKTDLSDILVFVPDNKIEVVSNDRINTLLVLTKGMDSAYFVAVWTRINNTWKILNIYEKQNQKGENMLSYIVIAIFAVIFLVTFFVSLKSIKKTFVQKYGELSELELKIIDAKRKFETTKKRS